MSASDGDGDEITYSLAGDDDHFIIDTNTGQIDLIKTLDRETLQEARLEVWATDNGKSSLHVHLYYSMLTIFCKWSTGSICHVITLRTNNTISSMYFFKIVFNLNHLHMTFGFETMVSSFSILLQIGKNYLSNY